jgi:CBS-domain-containing membrane protein
MAKAREIMTPGTECVGENETVLRVAELMTRLGVGALPICGEDNRLKGMVTDRDIQIRRSTWKSLGLGLQASQRLSVEARALPQHRVEFGQAARHRGHDLVHRRRTILPRRSVLHVSEPTR